MAGTDPLNFQPSKVYAWVQVGEVATDFNDSVTSMTVLNTIFDGESDSLGHRMINGMDVLIGTEILRVSNIDSFTDTGITIARAELSNTVIADRAADRGGAAASHDDGDAIYAWSELNDVNGNSIVQHLNIEDTLYQPGVCQLVLRNTSRNQLFTDAGIVDGIIKENTPIKVIDGANFSILFRGEVGSISKQHDSNGTVMNVTAYDALYQLGRSQITGSGAVIYYNTESTSGGGSYNAASADISDQKTSSVIKKLVQNYQADVGDGTAGNERDITTTEPISNSSNAEVRFRDSKTAKTGSASSGRISFESTQDSVLHSIQRLALTDINPSSQAFGYNFYMDANHYNVSTGLKTVPLLNYFGTGFMPAATTGEGTGTNTSGRMRFQNVSSTSTVSEHGAQRRIIPGASFDEEGAENVNVINVRYRDSQSGKMREIEMEAFYVGTGGAFSDSQFLTSYNPTGANKRIEASRGDPAGLKGAHDPRIFYDSASARSQSSFPSRVVDASNDIIGYVQYAGFSNSTAGLLVLSGTTNTTADGNRATVSAGQTIYLNSASSGNTKVLSAVTDPSKANTFRPSVATGKRVAVTMEFGSDYSYANIRQAVAARFLQSNNPKIRGRFQITNSYPATTFQSRVASSGDTITETTVGSGTNVQFTDADAGSLTDNDNGGVLGGYNILLRAGHPIMKLDGDGGSVTAHGYLSYVRKNNTSGQENLRFMLNTGSISANDYLRFAAPVRAGHMVIVDSQLHGVAARPALVTSMIYYETAGKAYTDIETIGFRDGSIKNDGTLDLSKVVAARRPNVSNLDDMVDDDYGGSYTFEDYKPHYRGQFYPGKSSSSDSSGTVTEKDDNVSWNAGTLYVGTETYSINAGCTDGATYGINSDLVFNDSDNDGNPDTHYIIFFDPHVSTSEFMTLTEELYEQRNSGVGRSAATGAGDLYPLSAQNLKIARVGASIVGAKAKIELFISQGAPTDAETSATDSTIVYAQGSIGGSALSGDIASSWLPTVNSDGPLDGDGGFDLGNSSFNWRQVHAQDTSINAASDRRAKKNIEPTKFGLDFINDLNPVSFQWNDTKTGHKEQGLIAQEVVEVLKKHGIDNLEEFTGIKFDEKTERYLGRYMQFMAPMMKAIQELSDKVNKLENEGEE
tara:strand:+ start:394 stop:3819 length:3426 start_codon:yes stop_codon:yes gene_type:complete